MVLTEEDFKASEDDGRFEPGTAPEIDEDGQLMRALKAEIRGLPVNLFIGNFAGKDGIVGIGTSGKWALYQLWRRIMLEANQGI